MSECVNGNIQEWEISDYEVGYACVKPYQSANTGKIKVHVPKLMPGVPMGPPKIITESLGKSCYINATECMPSIPSTIQTQNYLTIESQRNRRFSRPVLKYGAKVIVEVHNRNPDSLNITTKEDYSDYP